MKKLDWYILKKFLGTFFFIVLMIMIIGVVFDASEKMDEFIESGATANEVVFDYYVNFMAHYANMMSAFLLFIAVIFFTSKMAQNSEIIAMLSNGMSFNRLLRPYFIAATIVAGISLYFNQSFLPDANKVRLNFEHKYLNYYSNKAHYYIDREPGTTIYCQDWEPAYDLMEELVIWKCEGDTLVYELVAEEAHWDSLTEQWELSRYMERFLGPENDRLVRGAKKDTVLPIHRSEFNIRTKGVDAMNNAELNIFIEEEIARGSEKIQEYLVKKHQRTAYPFATYILTLIGVSIASRKVRGGIGLHLAAGVIFVMMYFFFQRMAEVAALNIGLNAFIAVWIPNIIFSGLALYLYKRAPK